MADPRFKVRRQAYFKRGITTASTINATGKVTLSGSMAVGGGTTFGHILTGSVGGCYAAVNASAAVAASFSVTGMSASHKVWASVYSGNDSCNLVITRVVPSTNAITASLANWVGTDISAAGSTVIYYFAIKD